jgi:chemotaxis protein CheD
MFNTSTHSTINRDDMPKEPQTFAELEAQYPVSEQIGLGCLVVSNRPTQFYSCIGVTTSLVVVLYDRVENIIGIANVVLPDSEFNPAMVQQLQQKHPEMNACFTDTSIPQLWHRMQGLSATLENTTAILVGGSQLFTFGGGSGNPLNIGARNVIMARTILARIDIPIAHTAVGGNKARDLIFSMSDQCIHLIPRGVGGYMGLSL